MDVHYSLIMSISMSASPLLTIVYGEIVYFFSLSPNFLLGYFEKPCASDMGQPRPLFDYFRSFQPAF